MIGKLGQLLRSGKTSCVELVQQTIESIKKGDRCNSLITLMEDEALQEAVERDKELAAGIDRGPLHGIPTAYKDLFYTRGIRTTAGSLVFRDFIPDHDATVVEKLKTAGAICIGKTNLHELAYGATSKNPHYGFVLNPHDQTHIPGGSSGGSATLVGAGFLATTLGTDTGGSVRIPASYCGCVGLKPTYGRVSRYGVLPLSSALDHVGPLAASVEDCALTMNAIAGRDYRDDSSARVPVPDFNLPPLADLKGIRIGLPKNFYFDRVDAEVSAGVIRAIRELERLGASVIELEIPNLYEVNVAARVIQFSEVASFYVNHHDPTLFGADVWALIEQGRLIAAHEYVSAQRIRTLFRQEMDTLWQKVDVLATPTTPVAAPKVTDLTVQIDGEEEDVRIASTRLVRPMNFVGEPALSMPCGRTVLGLPIGLQLIAPPFTEPQLLQVARTLEPSLPAHG
jgi:aspartyl-tRNA(Asn)/glutamyl-tRNA(Gln) amidotransferase subunit A